MTHEFHPFYNVKPIDTVGGEDYDHGVPSYEVSLYEEEGGMD